MFSILLLILLTKSADASSNAAFALAFMDEVNAARAKGCMCDGTYMPPAGKVVWHQKLEITATLHANQMVRYRFLEHYSKGGMNIGERANAVGYPWRTIGENLGRGQVTIHELIEDWKDSPSHCHVLMNRKFKEMGAAHVGEYWVLHLGLRKE